MSNESKDFGSKHCDVARQLAQLLPSSASSIARETFYLAGIRAARQQNAVHRSFQMLIAASLLAVSCSLSYLAGFSQSDRGAIATNDQENRSDAVALSDSVSDATRTDSPSPAESMSMTAEDSALRYLAGSLRLQPTKEEYLQRVDLLTTPVPIEYSAAVDRPIDRWDSTNRGRIAPAIVKQWLSM